MIQMWRVRRKSIGLLALMGYSLLFRCSNPITRFLDLHAETQKKDVILEVSGLIGSGLRIRVGTLESDISANGSFHLKFAVASGSGFLVSVIQHPSNPSQFCRVLNPSGIVGPSDISVNVRCVPGSAAGEMVSGNILTPLTLSGNVDMLLSEFFAGLAGSAGNTDDSGSLARFENPTQMVSDGQYIYVVESTPTGSIRRIHIQTRQVTTLGAIGGTDGLTSDGQNLYATNFTTCVIRRMRLADLAVNTIAGSSGNCTSVDAPSGPGSSARFNQPAGLAYDGTYIYVAEYGGNRIRRLDPNTGATLTLAGDGTASSTNNASASLSTFAAPHGLLYLNGKLYTTQFTFHAVRAIDLQNPPFPVTTFAGTGGFGSADGPAGTAEFKGLRHLATDGESLFVTDRGSYAVRRIRLSDGFVTTLSGADTRTTSTLGTGGTSGTAGFRHPFGITATGSYLFVGDLDDHIIRRIE